MRIAKHILYYLSVPAAIVLWLGGYVLLDALIFPLENLEYLVANSAFRVKPCAGLAPFSAEIGDGCRPYSCTPCAARSASGACAAVRSRTESRCAAAHSAARGASGAQSVAHNRRKKAP